VGDQVCRGCHANSPEPGFFDGYLRSGHPWKIFNARGTVPDPNTWPYSPVPPLPVVNTVQLEWSDVEYTIGNYYWKTRYIDRQGYIYTGLASETTQWNLRSQEWVPYHAGEVQTPFNCGRCHTTGYDPEGNQHGLPGLVGTWEEDGVRCEACHGPSSGHAADPDQVLPPGGKDCSECHFRDAEFRMPWRSGFMRHHQQSEDLSHSAHKDVHDCTTCHNPHRSVVYDDGGTITTCSGCHPGNADNGYYLVDGMENVFCIGCHMPRMGISAVAVNAHFGDIRGHLFQIMTDPIMADENVTGGFWNQDINGDAFITLDYACLGCHIEVGSPLTIEDAAIFAADIHNQHPAPVELARFELAETGGVVRVTWQTSMESNHQGFNVYRSEETTWQFEKMNPELITEPTAPGRLYEFADRTVEAGKTYVYQLEAVDVFGQTEIIERGTISVGRTAPGRLTLHQNSPNPFNPATSIAFELPHAAHVTLRIYDVSGSMIRTLVNDRLARDVYRAEWDGRDDHGRNVRSGVYFYRLEEGERALTRRLVMLR
jgi:hypothetical protein